MRQVEKKDTDAALTDDRQPRMTIGMCGMSAGDFPLSFAPFRNIQLPVSAWFVSLIVHLSDVVLALFSNL